MAMPVCALRTARSGAVWRWRVCLRTFCHNLAYRTQREQAYDRASSRADRIRKRLGWEPGISNGDGGKPKGMHWRTFEGLQAIHEANVQQSLAGIAARFGFL